jgi:hypothetical protein
VCLEPAALGGHEKEADMRRTQLITTAALVAACAVPATAAAQTQDLRSPDTRDAATAAARLHEYMYSSDPDSAAARAQGQAPQDLRSPDARDAKTEPVTQVAQDLRSPDARDAAQAAKVEVAQDLRSPDARDAGLPEASTPDTVVEIREVPSSGFDWGDAGIGAAGILALLSIAGGLILMVTTRRRRHGTEMPAH